MLFKYTMLPKYEIIVLNKIVCKTLQEEGTCVQHDMSHTFSYSLHNSVNFSQSSVELKQLFPQTSLLHNKYYHSYCDHEYF